MVKVSVKGSQDGAWGLTQSWLKNAEYHHAIDAWLLRHGERTLLCFVQFKGTEDDQLPRMYLARPEEVAAWLKEAAKGRGDTILYERHVWTARAAAGGTIDLVPSDWRLTRTRLEHLLKSA